MQLKARGITTVPGGRLDVAVDQTVCPKCQPLLIEFATEFELDSIDAHYHSRAPKATLTAPGPEPTRSPPEPVTPKTAARTATLGVQEGKAPIPTTRGSVPIYRRPPPENVQLTSPQPVAPPLATERAITPGAVAGADSRGVSNRLGFRPPPSPTETASHARTLRALRSVAKRFARGVGHLFHPTVIMPLNALLQFEEAVKAYSMALGTLAGEGAVLREEVRFALEFTAAAQRMLFDYERVYHEELSQASSHAILLILAGSEEARREMSILASGQLPHLESHLHEIRRRIEIAVPVEEQARDKWELAGRLLHSREYAFMSALATGTTATQAMIIAVQNDFRIIRGQLHDAIIALTRLAELLREDIAILRGYL